MAENKPSEQPDAKQEMDNCVGVTIVMTPPLLVAKYDHTLDVKEDLYAGDVSENDFLKKLILFTGIDNPNRNLNDPIAQRLLGKRYAEQERGRLEKNKDYIDEFMGLSIDEHIKQWKNLMTYASTNTKWYSLCGPMTPWGEINNLEDVALACVDLATTEKASIEEQRDVGKRREYTFPALNKALALHTNFQQDEKGKRNFHTIRTYLKANSDKIKKKDNSILLENSKATDKVAAVVAFKTACDISHGGIILVDGTMGYKIEVLSYTCLGGDDYEMTYRYTIYDHFGLDDEDISPDHWFLSGVVGGWGDVLLKVRRGFLSWYYLQRVKGYKPFVTMIVNDYRISSKNEETIHVK